MLNVLGMGYCHPNTIINNKFLEDLGIESSAAWIEEKIGILERRSVLPLEYIKATKNQEPGKAEAVMEMTVASMGVSAAKMALERAGLKASDIGLVICNTCTPASAAPTEAQKIADELGITAIANDVFTACPAFALHVHYLNMQKPETLPEYVLCIASATMTQRVDYTNRSDSAIWGDGAAAWIISPRQQGRLEVLATTFDADPLRCQAVVVDAYGHFHQDGRAVRDFSVRQTVRMIKRIESEVDIDWSRDIFIGHQANSTMLEQIRNNRDIPPENHWHNAAYIGNQAGGGAPAVLAQNWDKIKSGQYIVVAVLGAGLSWGSILFKAR